MPFALGLSFTDLKTRERKLILVDNANGPRVRGPKHDQSQNGRNLVACMEALADFAARSGLVDSAAAECRNRDAEREIRRFITHGHGPLGIPPVEDPRTGTEGFEAFDRLVARATIYALDESNLWMSFFRSGAELAIRGCNLGVRRRKIG